MEENRGIAINNTLSREVRARIVELFKAALTASVRLSMIDGVSDHGWLILLSDSKRACQLGGYACARARSKI
jgi:hypothetical protein